MKKQLRHWRRGAALLGAVALVVGVTALVPASSMAQQKSVTKCANKVFKLDSGGSKFTLPVKAITTEGGVSCAEAYEVIKKVVVGETPKGWKSFAAKFEAPEGLLPQGIKKGSKKIKFAVRGG